MTTRFKLELHEDVARKMNREQYKAARSYLRKVARELHKIPDMEEKINAGLCDLMAFGKARVKA